MDRREEFYLLKGLKITLERDKAQLASQIEAVGKLRNSYELAFATSGRKGVFELRGQEKTNIENQQTSIQAMKDRIAGIERDIAELTDMQNVPELKLVKG